MVIYLLQNCQANERKSALIEFSPNALALIFSLTQSKRHEKNKSVAYWMMYELNVWRCSMMHLMFGGEKEQEVERERAYKVWKNANDLPSKLSGAQLGYIFVACCFVSIGIQCWK